MNKIIISGNYRFKILQDFNNDLFDKKYIEIKPNGDIVLTVFNKDEFKYAEMYKLESFYGSCINSLIYHIVYINNKPLINIIYNMDDFIPYYIIYPYIKTDICDYSYKCQLEEGCNNIVKKFIEKFDTEIQEIEYYKKILFDSHEFNKIYEKNESLIYESNNKCSKNITKKFNYLNSVYNFIHKHKNIYLLTNKKNSDIDTSYFDIQNIDIYSYNTDYEICSDVGSENSYISE